MLCHSANTDIQKILKQADKIFESFHQTIKYLEKENFRYDKNS